MDELIERFSACGVRVAKYGTGIYMNVDEAEALLAMLEGDYSRCGERRSDGRRCIDESHHSGDHRWHHEPFAQCDAVLNPGPGLAHERCLLVNGHAGSHDWKSQPRVHACRDFSNMEPCPFELQDTPCMAEDKTLLQMLHEKVRAFHGSKLDFDTKAILEGMHYNAEKGERGMTVKLPKDDRDGRYLNELLRRLREENEGIEFLEPYAYGGGWAFEVRW